MLKTQKNETMIAAVETLCEGLEMCIADFEAAVDAAFQAAAEANPKEAEQIEVDRLAEKKFYRSRIETMTSRFRSWCEDDRLALLPKPPKMKAK